MRALHLIESGERHQTTTGLHSFLSMSVHAAVVLTAVYLTTRESVMSPPGTPPARVYFTPERTRAADAPSAPARKSVAKPAAPRTESPKVSPQAATEPSALPAATVPLDGPGVVANDEPAGAMGGRTSAYAVGEVEHAAASLSKGAPRYPERQLRLGVSGSVTARFVVDANGRVEQDIVILSATTGDFAAAVRDFLMRARFRPARVGGQPVRQLVEQSFVFQLRN